MKALNSIARRPLADPPGGALLWIIVGLELGTFALVFASVAWLRAGDPAGFAAGQQALSGPFGLLLTLILLTSGAFAAHAVAKYRHGHIAGARRYFQVATAVGAGFAVLKAYDYALHFGAGRGLGVSEFWDVYLLATGFHYAHVLVGLGLLGGLASRVGLTEFSDEESAVAGSALFWHMCDVAWFFLFPLFYAVS